MEILNIGGGEFLVILLFALIIFKPEDIYGMMRSLGRYAGKARRMWRSFLDSIEDEVDIKEDIEDLKQLGQETQQDLKEIGTSSQALINDAVDDLNNGTQEAGEALNSSLRETDTALNENLESAADAANATEGDHDE